MRKITFILFLFISLISSGQYTYYFSNSSGDDSGTGTIVDPFKTITKFNSITWTPGSTASFKRGDSWKGELLLLGDGTLGNEVVITAYGTGAKPIITALDTVSGSTRDANWSVHATNVWKMPVTRDGTYTHRRLWIDGDEKTVATSSANVSTDRPWFYSTTGSDSILYVYATGNPGSVYDSIQTNKARRTCIRMESANYFTISNLDLQNGYVSLWVNKCDGLLVDSCLLSGWYGIGFYGSGGDYSENNEVEDCVFDPKGLATTGYTYNPRYTEDAVRFTGGTRNTSVHDNYIKNYGHASVSMVQVTDDPVNERIDNILFYDNFCTSPDLDYGGRIEVDYVNGTGNKVYRNTFRSISISNQINGENFEFYYNLIDTIKNSTYQPNQGYGLIISGYNLLTTCNDIKVWNNVFSNCYRGIFFNDYALSGRNPKKNIQVINNIIYNSTSYSIYITAADSIYDNTFQNNLVFPDTTNVIYYRGSVVNVSTFNTSDTKQDTISGNIGAAPYFTGIAPYYFDLQKISPAINTGISVGLTSDYLEKPVPYGALPDIGAFEFYDVPVTGAIVFAKDANGNFMKDANGHFKIIIQ